MAMSDFGTSGLTPIHQAAAPLRAQIIDSMRKAIELGHLKPGDRLVEKDLCQQLSVSRTSLREALRELESEGVVRQAERRGMVVTQISLRDAENIYRIRADIEALIVEQFIERADEAALQKFDSICQSLIECYRTGEFVDIVEGRRRLHLCLCDVARNAVALELLLRLTLRTAQLRRNSLNRSERQEQSVREIEILRSAVLSRDIAKARKAAWEHVISAAASALGLARLNERAAAE
jgi:GntR family transcriptional regulator, trigonelline degradation regulator